MKHRNDILSLSAMNANKLLIKLYRWRLKHIPDKEFVLIMSFIVGIFAGFGAVIIKNLVRFIQGVLEGNVFLQEHLALKVVIPVVGIFLVVVFTRYILRQHVGHGIPLVLYAISRNNGRIKSHNLFSSIITSAITVGFGGSVGLEGPTVATGAAIGSSVSRLLRLDYKLVLMMLGSASAGAMSAIFKAPIAGIAFALEVIMMQFTTASVLPLLVASVSGALTAFFFMGQSTLYTIEHVSPFQFSHLHYYIILGVITGLVALYFTRTYMFLWGKFEKINNHWKKMLLGVFILGILIYLFPSLYGEGYKAINSSLHGDFSYAFNNTFYEGLQQHPYLLVIILLLIVFFKAIATTVTFAAGGVGGVFAPTLFMGVNTGLAFVLICNMMGLDLPVSNFALVGMGGMIAAVIQAPLTAIFLIAEITSGYVLFMPLMITVTVSWIVFRIFEKNSIYTYQLAKRGALFTHDQDKTVLSLMQVKDLIETNFDPVGPDATLGDLVEVVSRSQRNIFPVIDEERRMLGVVWVNDIRHIIFKPEMYNKVYVRDLMFMPRPTVSPDESMEDVARKFQTSSHYNLPVLEDGKYIGFVSRANVFSRYRQMIKHFSED
ncbi:MAG: CBS domain-containing protein [Chlorobi bacterium]|nr:CBS domain-containing protein [Chlorobiota bacterium]